MKNHNFSPEALAQLKKYSNGLQSAEATAYNIWESQMTAEFEPDPHAGDVIMWVKELGLGIPSETKEEASAAAERAIDFFRS